ncbi:glycosyltransferase family 4 protein [Arachidicoccus ginsenosidivorans]|uniref:Glycosyltransferase family 4 protein n=1 Tax=Arachidicoccus ginsenosidivorans TaxID=496057 RepID=A0A5B8VUV3_9BACT|nr:glycosyltransferase family 4 protein [Arachidicoccus ginsenosidivorans]QEC73948.1 glycosyltransferase family 4 protein [Arachidicoccus ginsenosidivorans]
MNLALKIKNCGHEVYILTKDTGRFNMLRDLGLIPLNINFDRSGTNLLKELNLIRRIRRSILKFQPDLIHNVTIKPVIYGTIAARGLSTVKIVNAISGLGYNFIDGRAGFTQKIILKLMKFAFKRKVNFIFQNPDDLSLFKYFGFLIDNDYRIIKGAGVDENLFPYNDPSLNGKLTVLFLGRLLKDKGIVEYFEAAKKLQDEWVNKVNFVAMGDVDFENPASISIKELNSFLVPDYIIWRRFEENVVDSLIESDIVCLPSYREGLPKSLIEAMAVGRPIITTDVPGCRECVENGYNGFLVPSKDINSLSIQLSNLLKNDKLRLSMGVNSRQKMINELSLSQVIRETFDFYSFILGVDLDQRI